MNRLRTPFMKYLPYLTVTALIIFATASPADPSNKPSDSGDIYVPSGTVDQSGIVAENGAKATFVDKNGGKVIQVDVPTGVQFPAINLPTPSGGWDLSGYTGAQIEVTNTGTGVLNIALRFDNDGDWTATPPPWNGNAADVAPGETKTITVTFGQSYDHAGFNLNPAKIVLIKIYAVNPAQAGTFQVNKITAIK